MTPQQLIDLPGYGSAKLELIKQGQWQVCVDDAERIEWLAMSVDKMETDDIGGWHFDTEFPPGYDGEWFRSDIDIASSNLAALTEQLRAASITKGTHHAPKR
jgi:hypothetical protein